MNKTFFIGLFFIFCYNFCCNAENFQTTLFVHLNDSSVDSIIITDGIKKGKMYINGENLDIIDVDSVIHSYRRFRITKLDMNTVTSIAEIKPEVISIAPNPVSNELYLTGIEEENVWIEIFSLTGELLFQKEIFSSDKVDISMLSAGLYLLKVKGQTLKFTRM